VNPPAGAVLDHLRFFAMLAPEIGAGLDAVLGRMIKTRRPLSNLRE
jgi:hypothetical protein